jgi:hypothetical protein
MHNSCTGRGWQEFKAAIGPPDANHWDPPLSDHRNNGAATETTGKTSDKENSKPLPPIKDAYDLCEHDVPLPPELIEGLLHQASKLSVGGASKGFKTWTLDNLGLSVAYGLPWLGHNTKQSKVLLIDLELQEAFCRRRLIALENACGIRREPGRLDVWNLRGYAAHYGEIFAKVMERISSSGYGLLILDPIYKIYGGATDENSARDVAGLMNAIERLAFETGAAVAFGSHFSKGNQAGKDAIDRVSGSGVFARDPDSLLNLTAHEEPDCYTLNATLRNFPPLDPFVVRWEFPLLVRDDALDPAALKNPNHGKSAEEKQRERQAKADQKAQADMDAARHAIVKVMLGLKVPRGRTEIQERTPIQRARFIRAWANLIDDGTILTAGEERLKNGHNSPIYRVEP